MTLPSEKNAFQPLLDLLAAFVRGDLRSTISKTEGAVGGLKSPDIGKLLLAQGINRGLLSAAAEVKRASAQIDVIIHALGILSVLPHILEADEIVEAVSLGAGNTGRAFDLETNLRVAEFKFITWRGGPESIRQNSIFKDFFDLATADTEKRRYLYLLGVEHPLKFFRGRRALPSVLSKNQATRDKFIALHGTRYETVDQYFSDHASLVEIVDLSQWLPEFVGVSDAEDASKV
jgi:hypothetical protein